MKTIDIKREFLDDWISREAGEKLRHLILEATKGGDAVIIDFSGLVIASTSFLDEGFAKLAQHGWTKEKFISLIRFQDIHQRDRQILERLFQNRAHEVRRP